jgi:hypothetical protein
MLQYTNPIPGKMEHTFVLKEIAHPGPTGQDELGHIFDNLGLLLGRESRKPFGKALDRSKFQSVKESWDQVKNWVGHEAYHFALPRQQDQVT